MSRPYQMLVLLLFSPPSIAETIKLKNGSVIQGSIVQMNETDVVIDTADMGQVKVKRRTVESITDGAAAGSEANGEKSNGSVNININNHQKNNQKVEQTNEQNVDVKEEPEEKKKKKRRWMQGFYGRLALGEGSNSATRERGTWPAVEAAKDVSGSGASLLCDLFGFRSASWWSTSFMIASGTSSGREKYERSFDLIGARFDANLFRRRFSDDELSQVNIGVMAGTASMTFQKDGDDLAEFSGNGAGAVIGYDYLGWKYLGLTVQAYSWLGTLTQATIDNAAAAEGISDFTADGAIKVQSSGVTAGVYWNLDL